MSSTGGESTLAEWIADAEQILVFSGAGISTGSGIQDFRGPQGVWKKREPVMYQDFMSSVAARIEYWDQKLEAWPQFKKAEPNPAHLAAVTLEKADRLEMVVTQNVDGLHQKAGTSLERLVEVHGTNLWIECMSCHDRSEPDLHFERFAETNEAPECSCGGYLKPATISFGQSLVQGDMQRAFAAAESADLVIALGSTLGVYPAASVPLVAADTGAKYVVVNRGPTEHDGHRAVGLRLEGDVGEIFPSAVDSALGRE